jgi:hypothetical protein
MSWESRKGRGRYYTRSRRVGGRIVREYLGCGETAELLARIDERAQEVRTMEAQIEAQQRAETTSLDSELNRLCQLVDSLSRAVLLSGGFHEHRGDWRKRREKTKNVEKRRQSK